VHYYIDGYNFLFRLDKKTYALEKKRTLFLITLNEEIDKLRLDATIVFDSSDKLRDGATRGHFDALEVVYTTSAESADDYILNAIKHSPHPRQETVVSSDRELTGRCGQLGANTLSIKEFLSLLQQKKLKKKKSSPITSFKETEKEIARFLKIFEKRLEQTSDDGEDRLL
jgi:predicted RNA-binding protein with PIN domain